MRRRQRRILVLAGLVSVCTVWSLVEFRAWRSPDEPELEGPASGGEEPRLAAPAESPPLERARPTPAESSGARFAIQGPGGDREDGPSESADADRSRPTRRGVPARTRAAAPGAAEREQVRHSEPGDASTPPGFAEGGGGQPLEELGEAAENLSDLPPDDSKDLASGEEGGGTPPVRTSGETLDAIAELLVMRTRWIGGEASGPVMEAIASLAQLQGGSQVHTQSELELGIARVLAAGELMLASDGDSAAADRVLAARDAVMQGRFAEAEETVHEFVGVHRGPSPR